MMGHHLAQCLVSDSPVDLPIEFELFSHVTQFLGMKARRSMLDAIQKAF